FDVVLDSVEGFVPLREVDEEAAQAHFQDGCLEGTAEAVGRPGNVVSVLLERVKNFERDRAVEPVVGPIEFVPGALDTGLQGCIDYTQRACSSEISLPSRSTKLTAFTILSA